jgi:hypothetical protein
VNAGAPTPAALESFEHFQAQPVGRGGRAELRASGEMHANAIVLQYDNVPGSDEGAIERWPLARVS